MRRYRKAVRILPRSLGFFVATAIVFALQLIPITGIFLMFMMAMFWSVLLINAGMVGTAFEALAGRVARWWLLLPAAFYGGYFAFAAADNAALRDLRARYNAANARITVPFDPARQALAFEGDDHSNSWLVQNYRLPVVYSRNPNFPEGFRSSRMMEKTLCDQVSENQTLRAASIYTSGFHNGDTINSLQLEPRFCTLEMPERPVLPLVTVARQEKKVYHFTLPITRVTTTVRTPSGQRHQLLGGVAAPLSWIPMPVIGCFLNSGAARWQCDAGFHRNDFTPIVADNRSRTSDSVSFARALGLKRVDVANRKGGDTTLVRAKMAEVEEATLARQLAAIDRTIVDPIAKVEDWQVDVVVTRPKTLSAKADAIMGGLERAAAVDGSNFGKTRESGRILARLVAELPHDRFARFGPRLLTLYRADFEFRTESDSRRQNHWLWESELLLRRLGDLGTDALFVAVDPRASTPNVNGAGIEAMCRIGAAGRNKSGPVLLDKWRKLSRDDRETRRTLFVAMRRVGIVPPPITESDEERAIRERGNARFAGTVEQQASPMDELMKDWADVNSASPPRVCSPNEWQARRAEQFSGKRRTNLN